MPVAISPHDQYPRWKDHSTMSGHSGDDFSQEPFSIPERYIGSPGHFIIVQRQSSTPRTFPSTITMRETK